MTDIEGTTSDIRFVLRVLFPYVMNAWPAFVTACCRSGKDNLRRDRSTGGQLSSSLLLPLFAFMDEDRNHRPQGAQGIIWREGYVMATSPATCIPGRPAVAGKWKSQGIDLYVYSSGSVAAQKLLFGYSDEGDILICLTAISIPW